MDDYASEDKLIKQTSKVTSSRIMGETISTSSKKFMDKEKFLISQDENLNELHKEQQRKKEEMLRSLVEQQRQTESVVSKMQFEKDVERKKLIDDIVQCKAMESASELFF